MKARLMLAGTASGCGKTTLVCGLLQALKQRGLQVHSFKSGPDYIDPMFHRQVLGTPSDNLDLFLMGEQAVTGLLSRSQGDMGILEAAMGFYDGIALGDTASAYELANTTQTPVVLVVNGKGAALSLAAVVAGFLQFREKNPIQGVIFNQVSPMFYPRLKEMVEETCGVQVYGFFPTCPEAVFHSRHLGLVTPEELEGFQEKAERLGALAEEFLDIQGLLALGQTAPVWHSLPATAQKPKTATLPLAVAQDQAFSFYYQENFARLEEVGFQLLPFSPLRDQVLPDCCGLYLGGGYPELHCQALSENTSMREDIRQKIAQGLPTIAECGGFLYLHESLENKEGQKFPMVGVIQASAFPTEKLSRFGYVTLSLEKTGLLGEQGAKLPAHQFHYWDSTLPGSDFLAEKPQSPRHWQEAHMSDTLYAGFPHLHFASASESLSRFFQACQGYDATRIEKNPPTQ